MKCQNHDKSNLSVKVRLFADSYWRQKTESIETISTYSMYLLRQLIINLYLCNGQDFQWKQFRNNHEEKFKLL